MLAKPKTVPIPPKAVSVNTLAGAPAITSLVPSNISVFNTLKVVVVP